MVERFNMKFVDEDTALLNIGKYDEDRVIKFITTLFKKQREEYDKKIEELNNEIYDLNESIDFMSK